MKLLNSLLIIFVFLISTITWAQEVAPTTETINPQLFTLLDCYQLALKQSEKVTIQKETIKEVEGRLLQALSGLLPNIRKAAGVMTCALDFYPRRGQNGKISSPHGCGIITGNWYS